MGFWNKYPYTDFHELNLSWFLERFTDLVREWDEFDASNHITYAGSWNITDSYPAWTIVSDTEHFYMALKPVPAGIALTNEEYWTMVPAVTSTPSEQNIRLITASYGTANGSGLLEITPFTEYLADYLHLDSEHYQYAARNGSGFGNGRFTELVQSMDASNEVTEVYVFGGGNDRESVQSHADVFAGMDSFTAAARAKFPNAKLYLGLLTYSYSAETSRMNDYADLAHNVYGRCVEHGFDAFLNSFPAVIQAQAACWVNTTDTTGMGHPSTEGSRRIAERLATLIKTKDLTFYRTLYLTYEGVDGVTISGSGEVLRQDNDGKAIRLYNPGNGNIDITFDTPQNISVAHGGEYTKIANILESMSCFRQRTTTIQCSARVAIDGTSERTLTTIELSFHDKQMYIRAGETALHNVTAIYLMPREVIAVDPYNA